MIATNLGDSRQCLDAVSEGFQILSANGTAVTLPGLPLRVYDFVALDPTDGEQIGVEVKTSWADIIRLNPQQVTFDTQVAKGELGPAIGVAVPGIAITSVMFYTYCFQCGSGIAQLQSAMLAGSLALSGIPVYPGRRLGN
jgi:hypothetical protein